MKNSPKLCLGTVQFGMNYGITNDTGQVPEKEVRRILNLAAISGIDLIDTAQSYGTAEILVGKCWPKSKPCRIISKLPKKVASKDWQSNLLTTMEQLGVTQLDGFLLHNASDLKKEYGKKLLNWMEEIRERGLVKRIGVSIYDDSELDGLPLDQLQLVQLPLSVFDQRHLRDGTIKSLHNLGISVHVRSVFLQGLLLKTPEEWPNHLSQGFQKHHARWLTELERAKRSALTGALSFIRSCEYIEAILVGVQSTKELEQVLEAWRQSENVYREPQSQWAWENIRDLDPRQWPTL